MKEEQQRVLKVGVQIAAGLLSVVAGYAVFLSGVGTGGYGAIGYILLGCACILVGAIFLAFPVAHVLAIPWGNLFFPEARYDRPLPMYSRAESLVKKERYEEAMAFYEEIAEEYPDEVKPFIDMIDIAVMHLADADRAKRIYLQGMSQLENVDARATLQRMFRAIRSRMDQGPEWGQGRHIEFKEQPPDSARKRWL